MSFLEGLFDCFFAVVQGWISSDWFIPLMAAALFCGLSVLIGYLFSR